uniref:Cytochrome c oxidase subunit 2 n=1 Tax=Gmelinoides fasciatus TaxID=686704 RepID=A0A1L5BW40_9CRUS|nr:cytochrome c oxidase subunit II [Gmelinoides fasciatus]APL97184.1 cytochrome c oxidase subunit II [Gmelinoides fasciatus]
MPTWHMVSFQDSASPSMEQLISFHDSTMSILITVILTVLMTMIFISSCKLTDRFLLQQQNIELIWTVAPVLVIVFIAMPSVQVLYLLDDPSSPNLTIKTIGHQWYWSYQYSDFPAIQFDSYMTPSTPLTQATLASARLLEADNSISLPTLTQIRLVATGADVIHAWSMPAFGLKADAIPGRLNQLMFSITRPGIFYGQCSEICGSNHSFMPIKVEAMPMKNFLNWIEVCA